MKATKHFFLGCSLLLSVVLGVAGCGSENQNPSVDETTESPSTGDTSQAPNPSEIKPDIHTNVPPPTSQSNLTSEMAQKFFETKEVFDKFSPELKERIKTTYKVTVLEPAEGTETFNTIMGRSAPLMYVMGGELPGGGCDPKSGSPGLICLDSPQDGLETVDAGVDVAGHIDLTKLAVFGASDPVAVVSVYNNNHNGTGGAVSEVPVLGPTVQSTSDPDIGKFSVAIGLSGAGEFSIVVSAYKVTETGGNELVSIRVDVTRVEAPEIEFIEARPDPENRFAPDEHKNDPVSEGAVISAENLLVKVKLTTTPGGVKTVFENYTEEEIGGETTDVLVSATTAGPNDAGEITGKVRLHAGLNKIKVLATSPALNSILGPAAPPPSEAHFSVKNAGGGPVIKILSPEKDGLIEQLASNQKTEVKFCYTFLPSKYTAATSNPEVSEDCVTGAPGFTPTVVVNGRELGSDDDPKHDTVDFNASTGEFTATITPDFGVNLYEINGKDPNTQINTRHAGAFIFGKSVALIRDGALATQDTFTKRGLNVDVDKILLENDVKQMVIKFLNGPKISEFVLSTFKKTASTPGYVCHELEKQVISGGDTTIDFLTETFSLGPVELTSLETSSDGTLHLGAVINGLHGEADLRATNGRKVTYNGTDIGFLPITLSVARLEVNLAVAFPKNDKGVSLLDIRSRDGVDPMTIIGDGELGNFVSINVDRNPFAAGINFLDEQQGLLKKQFKDTLMGTFLCGVEAGLNHPTTGALGKTVTDLEKLTGYDKNFLRLPLKFNLFGKSIELDAGVNLMKGDIKFDSQGIHVANVPVRVNAGPTLLNTLKTKFATGIMGMVSRFKEANEKSPQGNLVNDTQRIALLLSEDVINSALSGAVQAGLLELDLDANFYTANKIVPSDRLLPLGSMFLTNGLDVNQNGDTSDDATTPVMMRVKADPAMPPMLSFLTEEEVASLSAKEQELAGAPDPTPDGSSAAPAKVHFKPENKYFRLSVAALEISIFRQEPKANKGYKEYCKIPLPKDQNASLLAAGFCPVAAEGVVMIPVEDLGDKVCASSDLVTIPVANGDLISATTSGTEVTPLYRVRAGLSLIGTIQRVNREIPAADRVKLKDPVAKNLMRIKIIPYLGGRESCLTSVSVVENHTEKTDAELIDLVEKFANAAVGSDCNTFNEIKIPLPESLAGKADEVTGEPTPLLPDFNVDSLDLGGSDPNRTPQAFIDDSRIYIDILAYAGLKFTEDEEAGGK